jgi:hypothetical protein
MKNRKVGVSEANPNMGRQIKEWRRFAPEGTFLDSRLRGNDGINAACLFDTALHYLPPA